MPVFFIDIFFEDFETLGARFVAPALRLAEESHVTFNVSLAKLLNATPADGM
jgi:hypothetical protein